ncbi:MAG: DUF2459 domain-containing protein [Desulfocapsa sp.]|nr:DUF2459 domain-containing protein [Desulfocapsa sp.]
MNHGYHTGIVIPAWEIQSTLPQLQERLGNTPYIEFGWGNNLFYPAGETTTGLTLRAILWPTKPVIHAVAIPEKAEDYYSNSQVEKLCLSATGYSLLISYIQNSFYKNKKTI